MSANVFERDASCTGDLHSMQGCGESLMQLLRLEIQIMADDKDLGCSDYGRRREE